MAEIKYQLPRGTQDIYGDDMSLWQQAEGRSTSKEASFLLSQILDLQNLKF